ncbi:MAG: site-specific DNA-methyltransferase [Paludibacter sp.]|nr:site-specific DNA-methyltransferase [Paludibacter sp.]
MNKKDLVAKLKQLEGLTPEERAELVNLLNTKKKYGLVWEDKPEDVEEQLRTKLPVLREVVERRIMASPSPSNGGEKEPNQPQKQNLLFENDNEETTSSSSHSGRPGGASPNHILIEGDNLHALTALTFTHEGKIDVVYIDPPYNRGENDFKYNDNWIEKENPFKHSLWLNFISKRLKIAKRLLDNKGVMIIHIDEHEFDALNLLLETEIFSEEDSLGVIIWNKQNPKGDSKAVAIMHEYVLVYCKNKQEFKSLENIITRPKPNAVKILNKAKRLYSKIGKTGIPDEIKEVIKPFNFSKEILKDFEVKYDLELVNKEFQNWLSRQDFSGGEKAYKFIDELGRVYQSVSMSWPNKEQAPEDYFIPLIHPITQKPCPIPGRGWRNPTSTMKKLLDKKLILFGVDESTQPRRKYLLSENMFENTPSIYNSGVSDDDLFKEIGIEFPYPKPTEVAKYFLQSIHPNPKKILDFFAGSGTTLHATMQLNAEDGGNRQCILVTNNENNICEEVTYERNKRVIEGYTNGKGLQVAGLTNNNLRYFRSEYVGREKTHKNKRELVLAATELLCIKEDIYTELAELNGQKLNNKVVRCFSDKGKYMLVIYDEEAIETLLPLISAIDSHHKIKIYIFAPGQYPFTEEFEDVLDKVELCALPDAIYKAYANVLPKKKAKPVEDDIQSEVGEIEFVE